MSITKIKILGTGLTGLVGSRIVELLSDQYEFENVSYENGIDITNKSQVEKIIIDSSAKIVLHLAAKTDVDGCEKDKDEDVKILKQVQDDGFIGLNTAWAVNVEGTRNLVEACEKIGKKIIYISTDFVFDGNPPAGGPTTGGYTEEDAPNPINWYGQTKYEGEKIVQFSSTPFLICRIAFPYRASFAGKKDFVAAIRAKLLNKEKIAVVEDEFVTPTFIDDLASAIDLLIKNNCTEIYHLTGSSFHTPVEAAEMVADIFGLDKNLIGKITRKEYYQGRAPRAFSLKLKNDKLTKLGLKMSTFEEGLEKIKGQKEF